MAAMTRHVRQILTMGLMASLGACAACTSEPEPETRAATCRQDRELGDVCIGVPPAPVCAHTPCTTGIDCDALRIANDDASLSSALAEARPGSCVAPAPGVYGDVSVPTGVSLLGSGADGVRVGALVLQGDGARVRGMTASAMTVVAGVSGVVIEAVRVEGGGVRVETDASASFDQFESVGAGFFGVEVAAGANVTIENSLLADGEGPGVWSACGDGCDCPAKPMVTIRNVVIRNNRIVGLALLGSDATVDNVEIAGTRVGTGANIGLGGGGLSVAGCSSLIATGLRIRDNVSYGALIDDASAALGGDGPAGELLIENNLIGLWAQNVGASAMQQVVVENARLSGNVGVGLGLGGEVSGPIIICRSTITGTALATLPVQGAGVEEVGYGIIWEGSVQAQLEAVQIGSSARIGLLIDGAATGSLTDVTLVDGDQTAGIVQQSFAGGAQPSVSGGTPTIDVNASQLFAVPAPPSAVSALN